MSKINIPAGFVLVPREPTQEMMDAFEAAPEDQPRSWVRAYSDMIDVAPAPPVDAVLGEPVGEIVGTEKRGFALMTLVRWEPGFNRTKPGTKLYATPPAHPVLAPVVREPMAWADDEGRVLSAAQMENARNHQGGPGKIVAAKYSTPLFPDRAHVASLAPREPAAAPMYYLQCSRDYVGNCPMWWREGGNGYTTRLDEAGRYTLEKAVRQMRSREGLDVPWLRSEIDALRRPTVDVQDMHKALRNLDVQRATIERHFGIAASPAGAEGEEI